MPIFEVVAVSANGNEYRGQQYASDLKHLRDRERTNGRDVMFAKKIDVPRADESAFAKQKEIFFHRLASAMRHRGYDRATTAKYLRGAFPTKESAVRFPWSTDREKVMRQVCERLEEVELAEAMSQYPNVFTEEEVDAVATSLNQQETCRMLAKTADDQRELDRQLSLIWRPVFIAVLVFLAAALYGIVVVGGILEDSILPHATTVPPIFAAIVAARHWLSNGLHDLFLVVGVGLASLLFWRFVWTHRVVRLWRIQMLYRMRSYGRVKHGIERRRVYNAVLQHLSTPSGSIDGFVPRAARVANEAGKQALRRAAEAAIEAGNPLAPLRAAVPYLPEQEVGLLLAGWTEGGVSTVKEVLGELIGEINDDIPFDTEQAKLELRTALITSLAFVMLITLAALGVAGVTTVLSLKV